MRGVCGVLAVAIGLSLAQARAADIQGAQDHPMVGRYEGSEIIAYEQKAFDEYRLMIKPATAYGGKAKNLDSTKSLEGKITRITYRSPAERSVVEVMRNYKQALTDAGFTALFSCSDEICGGRNFNHAVVPYDLVFGDYYGGQQYLAALHKAPEGDVYVSLYGVMNGAGGGANKDRAMIQLDVIEVKPMEANKVVVDADALKKGLAAEGHVALKGVYFDLDKATLKAESKAALDEIAEFLKANPNAKVLIVGHTDNQGALAYNQDLSRRRAEAVVAALTADHGIASARLTAVGVGMAAPVASNANEAGRALNRRVELVER